ncbi:hypothetical protein CSC67_10575 [Pusillimonas caeni]|uniref:hypothetical protein n=1 Tax=Pusillimonas caeni TaxID=1348472 RepID=UPI000E59D720|nr:hypothetical protein [Pusillimonas caeni]TFL13695.1 hypothetical protein CSC67_10575 [Pusillimonas caeni]
MTKPIPDTDPLKREPPGELSKVPDNDVGEAGRPAGKPGEKGIDVPAEPGRPTPYPTNPDLPGNPPEPVDPGKTPSLGGRGPVKP